ncbi:GPW/gp25 family protein [Bilophila wadsworthia]|uniref:GPW/gp25 family protein n=1 Tax=Bilophila wadsworthia TaxID=35833 RepID=UPI00242C7378|nr:GPW/gp25 family protein [Bilophila wadsworthia]
MSALFASSQSRPTPSSPHWQLALGGDGVVQQFADIEQCIRIILGSPLGSDPLRPTFGSRVHDYLDWPLETARPHIVRETMTALAAWEPRIEVVRVAVSRGTSEERGTVFAQWRLAGDYAGALTTTKVTLGASV